MDGVLRKSEAVSLFLSYVRLGIVRRQLIRRAGGRRLEIRRWEGGRRNCCGVREELVGDSAGARGAVHDRRFWVGTPLRRAVEIVENSTLGFDYSFTRVREKSIKKKISRSCRQTKEHFSFFRFSVLRVPSGSFNGSTLWIKYSVI